MLISARKYWEVSLGSRAHSDAVELSSVERRGRMKWSSPPENFIKYNSDAAFGSQSGKVVRAFLCRDSFGYRKMGKPGTLFNGEWRMAKVQFETDSLVVASCVNNHNKDFPSESRSVMKEANQAADWISKHSHLLHNPAWVIVMPDELRNILLLDVGCHEYDYCHS
ncbi:conserved hypothetical protein [Ricinus communis]|uniref:RNase H type-1 domain-containing protein n=1 Tax=Ricinus communis TaxID=3988 RepID=B9R770_RICCO|nr:conserved hypothetical protein [Ricinus communis]